jgi:hypothetical protein
MRTWTPSHPHSSIGQVSRCHKHHAFCNKRERLWLSSDTPILPLGFSYFLMCEGLLMFWRYINTYSRDFQSSPLIS